MFQTVPLSIIRRFSLHTQQWYMSYRFADSLRAGSEWSSVLILLASCLTYTIAVCVCRFADSLRAGSERSSVLILLASCMTYTIAVCVQVC